MKKCRFARGRFFDYAGTFPLRMSRLSLRMSGLNGNYFYPSFSKKRQMVSMPW